MIGTEQQELAALISSICDYMNLMTAAKGTQAATLRQQIGDLRANGLSYINQQVFGTYLYNCFVTIRTMPVTAAQVAVMREQIQLLQPVSQKAIYVVNGAIQFCLSTESVLITQMTFPSKQDILNLMYKMKTAFDAAREVAADEMDSYTYQNLCYLAGSLINYLNSVALKLPSIVDFNFQVNMPSLTMANLIYQDASRSEELISENDVVHPLFMPRSVIGLSS